MLEDVCKQLVGIYRKVVESREVVSRCDAYPEAKYGSVACTASPSMVKEPEGWDQLSIPRRIWSFHFKTDSHMLSNFGIL